MPIKVIEEIEGNTFTHNDISYTFSDGGTELSVSPDPGVHNGSVSKGHGTPPEMHGKPEKKVLKTTGSTCYWYLSGGKWIKVCF